MPEKLAEAFVELKLKVDELEKGLKKAEKKTESSAKRMAKSAAKIAIAFTAVAATIGAVMGAKLVEIASDFEETEAKFKTVFEGLESKARSFSDELVASFGVSTREAQFFLSSIQDLLVPMGIASDKAADLSFETVKLATDLGSFNNLPTAQVLADMQSALVGNFETMKKYGVVLNETVIKQRALELGLGDATGKVNAAEKAQIALMLITESSAAAIGDFARTSDGFANTLKIVKARLEDAAGEMGKALLPAAKELLTITLKLIPVMLDFARAVGLDGRTATQKLIKEIEVLKNRQGELLQSLRSLSPQTELYAARVLALKNVSNKLEAAQKKVNEESGKNKDIVTKNIVAIEKLNVTTDKAKNSGKELEKTFTETWDSFAEGAKFAADTANDQFTAMAQAGRDFTSGFRRELSSTFVDAMKGDLGTAEEIFNKFGGVVVGVIANMAAEWVVATIATNGFAVAAQLAWASTLGPIVLVIAAIAVVANNFDAIKEKFDAFFIAIGDVIGFLFQMFKDIAIKMKEVWTGGEKGTGETALGINVPFVKFADGGIGEGFDPGIIRQPTFNAGGSQLAGEAGPEAIVPLKNGAIPVSMSGGGGASTITLVLKAGDDVMAAIASGLEAMSEDGRLKLDKSAIHDRAAI
jgi:hypothetical protein